ncbi:Hypothetical protein CINCED_3A022201 [Cinara cedri]|uniref:Uncharacterized protein n=1 Tax=Cinara cedri TaxID=506608 RepID=A0A5E4ML45_9HEMI|nr:Hypothetical protein CINCED_3A022201 [Cinara cedri]
MHMNVVRPIVLYASNTTLEYGHLRRRDLKYSKEESRRKSMVSALVTTRENGENGITVNLKNNIFPEAGRFIGDQENEIDVNSTDRDGR